VQCDQVNLPPGINQASDPRVETPVNQVVLEADNDFGPIDDEVKNTIC